MKKALLKVFGVAALAAGMLYNVQVFDNEISSAIFLAALGNVAVAQSEGGGTNHDCQGGDTHCLTVVVSEDPRVEKKYYKP